MGQLAPVTYDIGDICAAVSNGNTLYAYCKERMFDFGEVHTWVTAHPARKRQYETAVAARKDLVAQTLSHIVVSMIRFDPATVHHRDGSYKNIHDWPPEARAALEQLDVDPVSGVITKAKFTPRVKSLEIAGKMVGAFKIEKEQKEQVTLIEILQKSLDENKDGKDPAGEG
jgi:hypothetical protein